MKTSGPHCGARGWGSSNEWSKIKCLNPRKVVLGLGVRMLESPPQWLGRAMGGARTAPSGRGRDRRAEQGRAGPGWGGQGWEVAGAPPAGIRFGGGSGPCTPRAARRGPPSPQVALSPGPVKAGSQCEDHFRRGAEAAAAAEAVADAGARPAKSRPGPRPLTRPLGVPASAEGAAVLPRPGPPPCHSCTASGGSSSSTSRWWMRF